MNQRFSIRECLHGYSNDTLGAICDYWKLAATSKPSRLKAIERVLGDPFHVRSVLSALDPVSVRILKRTANRGSIPAADLLSVPGLFGTHQPNQALQRLAQSGMILVCPSDRNGVFSLGMLSRERLNGNRGPDLIVPGTVGTSLPEPPPLGLSLPVSADPPQTLDPPGPHRITQTMLEVFRLVDLVEPRITSAGEFHRNDEVRLNELRRESGLSRELVNLGVMMARQMRCVVVENRKLVTCARADLWTEQSRARRMRDLFWAYVASPGLADLQLFFPDMLAAFEEHLPVDSIRRNYHRELAVSILRESPEGAWHPVGGLADAIEQSDRNVLFVEERWRSILAHAQDSGPAWQERAWQVGEKRLFTWLVQSFLADLGMVELGGQGQLFRLSSVGRFVLGVGPEPEDAQRNGESSLTVQPDFEVIVYLDRCAPSLQRKLSRFCDRRRAGAASTYVLTEQSIYRGAGSGIPPREALQLLSDSSSHPLPDNVREQVAAWQRKMESITLHRRCTLVEFLDATKRDSAIVSYPNARAIGDRFLLVTADPAPASAPRIHYGAPLKAALRQEEGLQLRLPWDEVDLFARKRLAEIGELRENDSQDLCLRLERGKTGRPEDWNLIAAQLESLTTEPLRARYRLALRAWSGELGPATAGPATLLRFNDLDTCEAVLDFPEVAEHVEGRVGLYALLIRKGKLAHVKKALRAHGIAIETGAALADPLPPEKWVEHWAERRKSFDDGNRDSQTVSPGVKTVPEYHDALPMYSPRIVCELLADAIARRKPALIEYRPTWSKQASIRRVDPVSLDVSAPSPFLSAYCHTAHSARTFQLGRIQGIRILEDDTY